MMELRNMRYSRLESYKDAPVVMEGIVALYDANLIKCHQVVRLTKAIALTF